MGDMKIKDWFGVNLAELLSKKISAGYPGFNDKAYIAAVRKAYSPLEYKDRLALHAIELNNHLPANYEDALSILLDTLGPENPEETGMFTNYWWIMPIDRLPLFMFCREDKIRTCDPLYPIQVRYRAAPLPERGLQI